ncbi:helix-turn-helix domain-containing protein [Pseudoduganella umbonata]|uniref:Bacteriophage CI repressor N-terminal domain-containing protein n=1 Tax=Pseudoduganella umbonata TaxID=864828 RepID=A0A4P8HK11_9BURK|nr:helix-turn-helix domain-containing protein [Pseudoduganella umbonata]MBB3224903.1 hypothetical protein [Pseudoduganella umbonata]QCP09186.1 hypothetical protein FCL38_01075 [Pseudoduganella umbonata]
METKDHTTRSHAYDPARLLDALALHTGASSDARLAKKLQVSKHVIGGIRQRRISVSATLMLHIQEATGLSVPEIRHLVGDRRRVVRMAGAGPGRSRLR